MKKNEFIELSFKNGEKHLIRKDNINRVSIYKEDNNYLLKISNNYNEYVHISYPGDEKSIIEIEKLFDWIKNNLN